MSLSGDANGRELTGRVRKTNKQWSRVASTISAVKSDAVLDFMRRPSLATFQRAFPTICFNDEANRERVPAKIRKTKGTKK